MRYQKIKEATFLERPNRFVAYVLLDGQRECVHVKNTGRCKELLIEGVQVLLEESDNPNRKTKYDLVTVYKPSIGWINIDSQAPNKIAQEWLLEQGFDYIKPEYKYGDSRIDFYMEKAGEKYLMEVKGCTLEIEGKGYFPDAPTLRGVKHIRELTKAVSEGYHASLAFVIQMEGIFEVFPNDAIQPEFGQALAKAREAGVEVIFIPCTVDKESVCHL